jgi:hypothetical protein
MLKKGLTLTALLASLAVFGGIAPGTSTADKSHEISPRMSQADDSFSTSTYQDCEYNLVVGAVGGVSHDGGTSVMMMRIDPQYIDTTHKNPNECAANAIIIYRDGGNVMQKKSMAVTGYEPRDRFIDQVVSPDGSDMHLVERQIQTCKLGKCAPWTVWKPAPPR